MKKPAYWQPGEQITYREVWQGKVWTVRPVTIVQDTPNLIILSFQYGTRWKNCTPGKSHQTLYESIKAGEWELEDTTWNLGDTLFFIYPGEAHAAHVMWSHNPRKFVGWYINLQEPLRRTAIGFDFMDHDLDIVIQPDFSWYWKDEDIYQQKADEGFFTPEEAKNIRTEGEKALRRMEKRQPPFDRSWLNWMPPKEWEIPVLKKGWDIIN